MHVQRDNNSVAIFQLNLIHDGHRYDPINGSLLVCIRALEQQLIVLH